MNKTHPTQRIIGKDILGYFRTIYQLDHEQDTVTEVFGSLSLANSCSEIMKVKLNKYHYCKVLDELENFITIQSQLCIDMKAKVTLASAMEDSVFIQGPTGVGKEIIARALHGERTGQFIACNANAMTETLIESELFGHIKGSFTGAVNDRKGLIRAADDGTLFLDEIGDLPELIQVKLLRVLEDRTFKPVGSDQHETANCRFLAATSRVFSTEHPILREDLYHRLARIQIQIPALVDRMSDIPPIAEHIIALNDWGSEFSKVFNETAWDKNTWATLVKKGNVRQLEGELREMYINFLLKGELT